MTGGRDEEKVRAQSIEAAWFGEGSCADIARRYGVVPNAVYAIWSAARRAGRIPPGERPLGPPSGRPASGGRDDGEDGRPSTGLSDPLLDALRANHTLADVVNAV